MNPYESQELPAIRHQQQPSDILIFRGRARKYASRRILTRPGLQWEPNARKPTGA